MTIMKLLLVIVGIIIAVISLICFISCISWMISVTKRDYPLGYFWEQLWSTIAQEIVLVSLIISWCAMLYGVFLIFGIPNLWTVKKLFIILFLPSFIIWGVAKLISTINSIKEYESEIVRLVYTVIIAWQFFLTIGLVTFIPIDKTNEYYGQNLNSNKLFCRTGKTLLMIYQMKFFRSEIDDKQTLRRYLYESVAIYDKWHSKRENWGASRDVTIKDYKKEYMLIDSYINSSDVKDYGESFLYAKTLVLDATDYWWMDIPNPNMARDN